MGEFPQQHLLLVDDEGGFREVMAERLLDHGFRVEQAATGEEALDRLNDFAFDILVTDLRLPGIDGRRILDEAFARYPEIIAIVITGFGTVREAVEVTRLGVEGFITKPFQFEELLHELNAAIEKRRLKAENAYLRAQLHDRFKLDGIIGRTPVMLELFELLKTVAATASTVLVSGETGTGKELAARAIHDSSMRGEPAICRHQLQRDSGDAARGRALRPRPGRVHWRRRQPAGTHRTGPPRHALSGRGWDDERGAAGEAAARHPGAGIRARRRLADDQGGCPRHRRDELRPPETWSTQGLFREDLYYRLNVIPVRMPPLRERRADIPILAQHFLDDLAKSAMPPRGRVTLGQDAQQALMAYAWPGNVRQLENVMERTFALSPGRAQIMGSDLPEEIRQARPPIQNTDFIFPDVGIQMERLVSDFEHNLIRRALERTGGNKRQAAELLNVKRTTLIEKLKRLERN